MKKCESPMSKASVTSVGSPNSYVCYCGLRARMYTSWSLKNPGRRFCTCIKSTERCDYFEWYDAQFEGRHGDVITHLNNRRIFLEEKISLLEEQIQALQGIIEEKKKKKLDKKKKASKLFWFSVVVIVFVAVLLVRVEKSATKGGWLYLM